MSPLPSSLSAPIASRIVRESTRLATWNAMRAGMLALMTPVMTSTDGRWVATMQWMPAAARHLRDARDGHFDIGRRDEHQVRQLVMITTM